MFLISASCDCCGVRLLEIKCPFCKKTEVLDSVDKHFYLKKNSETGELNLDPAHMYYYQIQTQLGVCKKNSSYFVVWTEVDMHVEIIDFNPGMWSEICSKSKVIFDTAIMPEIVGKFFTRIHKVSNLEKAQGLEDHTYL